MGIVPTPESDRARFWAKVNQYGDAPSHCSEIGACWLWTAARFSNGYGAFRVGARQRRAHVVSYEWHVGPIPDGLLVLHRCDVRHCVRPEHLMVGTQRDNIRDMFAKGRESERRGSANNLAVLTENRVREIISMAEGGAFQEDIARAFGISQAGVSKILRGRAWAHVTGIARAERTRPRQSADAIATIRALAAQGLSYREIGLRVGCSVSAAHRIATDAAYPQKE